MTEFYPEGVAMRKEVYSESFLEQAMQNEEILEGVTLLCDGGHNLLVELGSMKGVITREEGAIGIKEGFVRDIALISRVGKIVCFTVRGFDKNESGEHIAVLAR